MSTDEAVREGLRRFAQGDSRGAAEVWHAALRRHPGDVRLGELLDSLARAEAGPSPSAASGPLNAPWAGPCVTAPVVLESAGPGLEVFVPPRPSAAAVSAAHMMNLQRRLRELQVLHDFTGALEVAETILRAAPGYAPALRARHECRDRLEHMYTSRLGDLKAVPKLRVGPGEILWLGLDQRAGFVLSQVDGVASFAEIQEIAGLPHLESLRILSKLVTDEVIGV